MKQDAYFDALAFIREEYATHGHKTKRCMQAAVENGVKKKARNKAILEGLMIYEKRKRGHP
jgi:hypothetical protein